MVEMRRQAVRWQRERHSSATQAIQLRGLLLLIHPDCLEAIGGFDTRFGMGNFEDDDLNLRARLAGFTLWIADGAFAHHYGSTTFRKLGLDYEGNIARNAESFLRKWRLHSLEEWGRLCEPPEGVSLRESLEPVGKGERALRIRINGEPVDLIRQATDIEFGVWVASLIRGLPPEARIAVARAVQRAPKVAARAQRTPQ
jgi:hypothetical protein